MHRFFRNRRETKTIVEREINTRFDPGKPVGEGLVECDDDKLRVARIRSLDKTLTVGTSAGNMTVQLAATREEQNLTAEGILRMLRENGCLALMQKEGET